MTETPDPMTDTLRPRSPITLLLAALAAVLFLAVVHAQPELTNTEATNIDTAAERLAWQQAIGTDYELKTSGFTAEANGRYVVNGTTTVTDPSTPSEGTSFFVFVQGGSVTVGGTAYTVAGTGVYRIYVSAAWANYVSQPFAGYAANNTWTGTNTFNGSVILGADITAGAGAWDGASFTGPQAFESVTMTGDLTVDTTTLKVDSTNNRVGIGTLTPSRELYVTGAIEASTFGVFPAVYCDIFKDASPGNNALNLSSRGLIASDGSTTNLTWGTAGTLTNVANIAFATGKQISFTDNSGTWNGTTFAGAQTFSGQVELTGQAASGDDSAMTRSLSDSRYPQKCHAFLASDTSYTNDATGATILSLTIPSAGRWEVSAVVYFGTNPTNSKTTIGSTSTGIYCGYREYHNSGAAPTRVGAAATGTAGGGPWGDITNVNFHNRFMIIETSGSVTITINASQNASDPTTTTVDAGSYIRAVNIQ